MLLPGHRLQGNLQDSQEEISHRFYKLLPNSNIMVNIKGQEIEPIAIKDSANRRSVQFSNNIVTLLHKIGLSEDDIEIPLEGNAVRKARATATWFWEGFRLQYSHNLQAKFVENLYMVYKVIENEVNLLLSGKKTPDEFIAEFREDEDVDDLRKEARDLLGVEHDVQDIVVINKKYKQMAKELHPDMPNGSTEKFKQLNNAHKLLKKELT